MLLFLLGTAMLATTVATGLDGGPDAAPSWWPNSKSRSRRAVEDVVCGRGGNGPKSIYDTCAATKNRRRRGHRELKRVIDESLVCNFVADQKDCALVKSLAGDVCRTAGVIGDSFRAACPAACETCEPRKICGMKFDDTDCFNVLKMKGETACDSSYVRKMCPAACHEQGCPLPPTEISP